MSALQVAISFIARGWSPIPVAYRGKVSVTGWPDLRISAADAPNYFSGDPMNIGVLTGSASGGLVDVDLDCDEAVELASYFAPESDCAFGRESRRRSHIEFVVAGPFDSLKLIDPDLPNKEATIIELRGDARQTVFPGSVHESGEPITWDSNGEPGRASGADLKRAVEHIAAATLLVRSWNEGVHDDLSTALIGCLLRAEWPDDEIENFVAAIVAVAGDPKLDKRLSKIERLRHRLEVGDGKGVPGLPSLISHMGSKARANSVIEWLGLKVGKRRIPLDASTLDELNQHHALVWIGGELAVLWLKEWDGTMPRLSRIGHMTQYYRNRLAGKINPFNAWLESPTRAEYPKIVFEPGVQRTPGAFNLFDGWAQEPREGDCTMLLELLRDVWCAQDEGAFAWVQDWFADLYQNPDRKPGTAIATVSKPGAGKNAVFRYVHKTLGRYCTLLAGSDSILGHFNDHLAGRLLIFGDEAVWPRDKRGAAKLKSYITEPEISVERKHVPRVDIANHARFIFATNDDLAAPTELDDRRYTVLRLAEHRVHDRSFWEAFHRELNGGGPAAFAWHCLNRVKIAADLRKPYDTAALAEQKVLNLDHIGAWWLEMLGSEDHEMADPERSNAEVIAYLRWSFGTSVLTKTLHAFYLRHAQKMRVQFPASPTELGVALVRRYLPQLAKREARATEKRHLEVEGRAYCYDMPSLQEAREALERKLGRPMPWPPGEGL